MPTADVAVALRGLVFHTHPRPPQPAAIGGRRPAAWVTLRAVPFAPHRPPELCRGPFVGRDAVAAGAVTRAQLRGPAWRRLGPDVYLDARIEVTPLVRILAAGLWLPEDAVVTGRSAAQHWGVDLDYDGPVEVVCPRRLRRQLWLSARMSPLDSSEVVTRQGVRVTGPHHTAWEIARARPEAEAITWVDALARRRRLVTAGLVAHAFRHKGEMGSRRAAALLALADPRAESPPESVLRLAIVRAGLPPPVPQYTVYHGDRFVARVDLAWPRWRLAVEYDGQWHASPDQLHRDRVRLRELNAAGWVVYSVTREDLRHPDRLIRDITAFLAAA